MSTCSQKCQGCPQCCLPMSCRIRQWDKTLLPHPLLSAEGSWSCWAPAVQDPRGQGPWRCWVAQGASLSPTPQELKHKILLKGKKIGRLEDTLDGPGDEAPDVSDDDNGAEAEEERRRAKVNGLGWEPAGRAEPLDTAMSCDDILLHRRETETAETSSGREDSFFWLWLCQPSLCCGGNVLEVPCLLCSWQEDCS